MDLDRQELPPPRAGTPPQRVPEPRPPLLGDWFIYLSSIVLICGTITITAIELGTPLEAPLVKWLSVIGAAVLLPVAGDAAIRTWRSAFAWWPVHRPRAIQRFIWTAVFVGVLVASVGLIVFMVSR